MDYPFLRCLNPQHVVNAKGEEITVPCRCCRACLMNKANKMSFLCSIEEEDYKYCVFFTLTYANPFVPLALPVPCIDHNDKNLGYLLMNKCDRLASLGVTLGFSQSEHYNNPDFMKSFLSKVNLNGYIPYLSKLDLQRFFKRFRKELNKYTDEKVRYYACGEYGPRTFRPHYHGLLFFNKRETFENYAKCLCKAWTFGRVDASLSRSKAASYVARYVNSSVALPRLYEISSVKPFASHSVRFAQGFYQSKKEEIYKASPVEFIQQCRQVVGKNVEFHAWRSLTSAFFPKCREYDGKSYGELLRSYTILRAARKRYGEDKPISYLAQAIYSDPTDNECTRYFCDAYEIKGKRKRIDPRKYSAFTPDTVPYPAISVEESEITGYQRAMNYIQSELYISRHFLTFVCKNQSYHEIERKIKKIQDFYRTLDYLHLKKWYQSQEEYFSDPSASLRDVFHFFDNLYNKPRDWHKNSDAVNRWLFDRGFADKSTIFYPDECDDLKNNFMYKSYRVKVVENFNNSIKHKELNDLNKIFLG